MIDYHEYNNKTKKCNACGSKLTLWSNDIDMRFNGSIGLHMAVTCSYICINCHDIVVITNV